MKRFLKNNFDIIILILLIFILITLILITLKGIYKKENNIVKLKNEEKDIEMLLNNNKEKEIEENKIVEKEIINETLIESEKVIEETKDDLEEELYYDSLEYLAMCVEAEAGNQGLLGKQYVVDVILNRVDSDDFPDTIIEVINQKNQFAVVSSGMINRMIPTEQTYEAIRLEFESRTDSEILFFRTKYYHKFGTPCFQYKDHYFSK